MTQQRISLVSLLLSLGLAAGGCSTYCYSMGSNLGVTQGGSQDIGLAREIIEGGYIPTLGTFTAEGLFSEHDLPLQASEPCDEVLCPQAAAARIDPVDGSGEQFLVQFGFDTSITSDTFHRLPLNLAVAVDVSGSMSDGKLDAVKTALQVMMDQLGDDDRMALVSFDHKARVEKGMRQMDSHGRDVMRAAIEDLSIGDDTCIACGMELAYGEVAPDAGQDGVEDRVMLFTDARPNVGGTSISSFMGMARYYGAAGIGLSLFGVGMDMDAELASEISQARGGNSFYLSDITAIEEVFDDEFDYIVTPLAYDLRVRVTPAEGLNLVDTYGAPLDMQGEAVDFGASTLFLSSNAGGMGITLVGEMVTADLAQVASLELAYTPSDTETPVEQSLVVQWNGGQGYWTETVSADDLGVFKMGCLVDEYLALMAGADFCEGIVGWEGASYAVVESQDRLQVAAGLLQDAALGAESDLMGRLAENLVAGEAACW